MHQAPTNREGFGGRQRAELAKASVVSKLSRSQTVCDWKWPFIRAFFQWCSWIFGMLPILSWHLPIFRFLAGSKHPNLPRLRRPSGRPDTDYFRRDEGPSVERHNRCPEKVSGDENGRLVLVVWNMNFIEFYFPIYWECQHPNWWTHIFQRGRHTTNQQGCSGDEWWGKAEKTICH